MKWTVCVTANLSLFAHPLVPKKVVIWSETLIRISERGPSEDTFRLAGAP